jgi:hypothetical protein
MRYIVIPLHSERQYTIDVPNFRNKEERERYRYDNACTNPNVAAGNELLPVSSKGEFTIPDSTYGRIRELWLAGKKAE